MKFDKSQDSSWDALVVYINSQCILAGFKPQKEFCLFYILSFINFGDEIILELSDPVVMQ